MKHYGKEQIKDHVTLKEEVYTTHHKAGIEPSGHNEKAEKHLAGRSGTKHGKKDARDLNGFGGKQSTAGETIWHH